MKELLEKLVRAAEKIGKNLGPHLQEITASANEFAQADVESFINKIRADIDNFKIERLKGEQKFDYKARLERQAERLKQQKELIQGFFNFNNKIYLQASIQNKKYEERREQFISKLQELNILDKQNEAITTKLKELEEPKAEVVKVNEIQENPLPKAKVTAESENNKKEKDIAFSSDSIFKRPKATEAQAAKTDANISVSAPLNKSAVIKPIVPKTYVAGTIWYKEAQGEEHKQKGGTVTTGHISLTLKRAIKDGITPFKIIHISFYTDGTVLSDDKQKRVLKKIPDRLTKKVHVPRDVNTQGTFITLEKEMELASGPEKERVYKSGKKIFIDCSDEVTHKLNFEALWTWAEKLEKAAADNAENFVYNPYSKNCATVAIEGFSQGLTEIPEKDVLPKYQKVRIGGVLPLDTPQNVFDYMVVVNNELHQLNLQEQLSKIENGKDENKAEQKWAKIFDYAASTIKPFFYDPKRTYEETEPYIEQLVKEGKNPEVVITPAHKIAQLYTQLKGYSVAVENINDQEKLGKFLLEIKEKISKSCADIYSNYEDLQEVLQPVNNLTTLLNIQQDIQTQEQAQWLTQFYAHVGEVFSTQNNSYTNFLIQHYDSPEVTKEFKLSDREILFRDLDLGWLADNEHLKDPRSEKSVEENISTEESSSKTREEAEKKYKEQLCKDILQKYNASENIKPAYQKSANVFFKVNAVAKLVQFAFKKPITTGVDIKAQLFNKLLRINNAITRIAELRQECKLRLEELQKSAEVNTPEVQQELNSLRRLVTFHENTLTLLREARGELQQRLYFDVSSFEKIGHESVTLLSSLKALLPVENSDKINIIPKLFDAFKKSLNPQANNNVQPQEKPSILKFWLWKQRELLIEAETRKEIANILSNSKLRPLQRLTAIRVLIAEHRPASYAFWRREENQRYQQLEREAVLVCLLQSFTEGYVTEPEFANYLEQYSQKFLPGKTGEQRDNKRNFDIAVERFKAERAANAGKIDSEENFKALVKDMAIRNSTYLRLIKDCGLRTAANGEKLQTKVLEEHGKKFDELLKSSSNIELFEMTKKAEQLSKEEMSVHKASLRL